MQLSKKHFFVITFLLFLQDILRKTELLIAFALAFYIFHLPFFLSLPLSLSLFLSLSLSVYLILSLSYHLST